MIMDPFSITAGVAGLLSLSIQLTETLTEYTSSVKHAAEEAKDLYVQIIKLSKVLRDLDQFLKDQRSRGTDFDKTAVLYDTVVRCHGKLSSLDAIIQTFMQVRCGCGVLVCMGGCGSANCTVFVRLRKSSPNSGSVACCGH